MGTDFFSFPISWRYWPAQTLNRAPSFLLILPIRLLSYELLVSCNLFLNAVYLLAVSCRRTAMPNAFFVPTRTTSFFPLVTAV